MYELFQAMLWPIMAGLLLPPFLIYFGVHLLERRNPFAALAFPQLALLGTTVSTALHLADYPIPAALLLTILAAAATAFLFNDSSPGRRNLFTAALFCVAMPITLVLLIRQTESADEATHALYGSLLLVNKHLVLRSLGMGLASALLAAIVLRTLPPSRF